jgi:outer membrane protein OmpA-like peptidoglycan-associated protein
MKIKPAVTTMTLVMMALSGIALPGAAQQPQVLEGSEITESKLLDALAPKEGVRTRSFKVRPDQPCAAEKAASISMRITFPTNSAKVTDSDKEPLDVLGRTLNMNELKHCSFVIEGHADPRGGAELNQRLSEARAQAVKDYLVEKHDIDKIRLTPIGKGDQELLNKQDPTDPKNRRVTIVRKPK